MREALTRAAHDLDLLGRCLHADPATRDELFEVDLSNTRAGSGCARRLEPLTIDPQQPPPA